MSASRNKGSLVGAVLLALLLVPSCGDGSPEPTHFELLSALRYRRTAGASAHAGDPGQRLLFGDEWYSPVLAERAPYAWMRGRRASLELLVQQTEELQWLELELKAASRLTDQSVEVFLNDESLGAHGVKGDWERLAFPVPAGVVRTGVNRVELVAERELDEESGQRLSLALGRSRLTRTAALPGELPSRLSQSLAEAVSSTLRFEPGQLARVALFAHPDGQLELELSAPLLDQASRARVCVRARGSGPVLYERVVELDGSLETLRIDLAEAAGDRLELELGALPGGASVEVSRADLVVPRAFSDLVIVVVDTLRADRILDPEDRIDTPRIDEFEREGVQFTRAYSHANLTLPSHTALFSSRLPSETGVPLNAARVRGDLPLLSEWMEELGYRTTATISMGTLRPVVPQQGLDRGFAKFDDDLIASMDGYWANERLAPDLASLAHSNAPFFLFAHYSDPHTPFRAHGLVETEARISLGGELKDTVSPPEVVNWQREYTLPPGASVLEVESEADFSMRYLRCTGPAGDLTLSYEEGEPLAACKRLRAVIDNPSSEPLRVELEMWLADVPSPDEHPLRYDREVEHVDGAVGALFDELKRLDLFDDALIVFTSDHGEGLGDHGQGGHGKMLFNDQVHVPLIIKLPGGDERVNGLRARRDQLANHLDVVPTALEMLGLPALPGQRGISLLEDAPRLSISESHYSKSLGDMYALRDGRYVLMYGAKADLFALFDTEEDPGELNDIFAERGHEFEEWQQLLRELSAGALEGVGSREELDADAQNLLRGLGYTDGGE